MLSILSLGTFLLFFWSQYKNKRSCFTFIVCLIQKIKIKNNKKKDLFQTQDLVLKKKKSDSVNDSFLLCMTTFCTKKWIVFTFKSSF